jgi:hypothetical protein
MSISDTFEPNATFFSPDATPPQTFHQWPDLPAELKLEVLAKVLSSPDERDWGNFVTADSHRENLAKCLFPIIKTRSRELVELAMDVYYKRNVSGSRSASITIVRSRQSVSAIRDLPLPNSSDGYASTEVATPG